MKKKIVLMFLLMIASISFAQIGGNFEISKSSIDAGGGLAIGGSFSINSSIGQADASNELSGGGFSLTGGFWASSSHADIIFINGFE
jgi:hypothetical protein